MSSNMGRGKAKGRREFSCEEEHEFVYVSGLYRGIRL